jgi:hypothetical protein
MASDAACATDMVAAPVAVVRAEAVSADPAGKPAIKGMENATP